MDIETNIEALEQRYQILYDDFQAGKIDDVAFISEVDKLQFQDNYGRYWMIGAQTGAWHYYDGQSWQQVDPREADNLPFMDEQGRYWQRGVKSGDWYYHHPETGEWVKPNPDDESSSPFVYGGEQQAQEQQPSAGSYQSWLQPQNADTGPEMPSLDSELFQDDEGRYWAVGNTTGQWYFFDHEGWHPAHEFQPTAAPQAQPYQPQTPPPNQTYYAQTYQSPPSQVSYQPVQSYAASPHQPQEIQGYAAQPQPAP